MDTRCFHRDWPEPGLLAEAPCVLGRGFSPCRCLVPLLSGGGHFSVMELAVCDFWDQFRMWGSSLLHDSSLRQSAKQEEFPLALEAVKGPASSKKEVFSLLSDK